MNPLVSVIIVNYNCQPWLERFFPSLRAQTIFDRCEFIVVDNSSKDGSAETCRRQMESWPNGRFLPTGGNLGYGGGCNFGAATARGKYLFFLNPDVWFEPDCLEALVHYAEASPAKVFSAMELGYEEPFVPGHRDQGSPGFDIFGCITRLFPNELPRRFFATGSFFFIEREFFLKLAGFDAEFFVYGEEMDMAWRSHIAGSPVELARAACVHHAAAGSTETAGRTSEFRRFCANRNVLLTILKNAHGPLLLLVSTNILLTAVESLAGALLARRPSFFVSAFLKPLADCWRLRHHVLSQRRLIRGYRRRGDWWIARHFLRLRFGHWGDIKRFLKWRIAIEKSPPPPRPAKTSP